MAIKIVTKYSCSMKLMNPYGKKYGPKIDFDINDEIWQNIFNACMKSIIDNDLVWFQYKILFNILNTNECLYKIKISKFNLCRLYGEYPETILHLFAQCKAVQDLWQNLNRQIRLNSQYISICVILEKYSVMKIMVHISGPYFVFLSVLEIIYFGVPNINLK